MSNHRYLYINKFILALSILGVLSGCAVKSDLVGARWVVVGKIKVAPNQAGIYYQYGKRVAAISGDQYRPWCQLVLNKRVDDFRMIKSGSYEITWVTYNDESVSRSQSSFKTHMRLSSSAPVQLYEIICGNWDDNSGSYLTNTQMQQALQGVMKLETGK